MTHTSPETAETATAAEPETPCLALDYERLVRNVRGMQARARRHGVKLRPHIKTHKCVEVARMQLEEGAVGITAAKPDEALVFIEAGVPSVTLAYPVIGGEKLDRLLRAARLQETELLFIVDSGAGVDALAAAAQRHRLELPVFVKVDVGLNRCGVGLDRGALVPLVRHLAEAGGLRFRGLLSHAGQSYGVGDADGIRAVAHQELEILRRASQILMAEGHAVDEISVGATPTALADGIVEGTTEIRPGNYVFQDLTPVRLGVSEVGNIALTVMTTIVSANDRYYIVDAGSKVLTSDLGPHGSGGPGQGYGLAAPPGCKDSPEEWLRVEKLSEEHGFVARGASDLPIGTVLHVMPNHSCPVTNLADWLVVIRDGRPWTRWRVAARGCSR